MKLIVNKRCMSKTCFLMITSCNFMYNSLSAQDCATGGQLLYREDFGGNNTSDLRVGTIHLPLGITEYTFCNRLDTLSPNEYALVKYADNGYAWHLKFSDHTHPGDITRGYMFMVDASDQPKKFYETQISDLCDNINKLHFSAWIANLIPQGSSANADPVLKFEILDVNGNLLHTYVTPKIPRYKKAQWDNYGFDFDPKGHSSLILKIYNNTTGTNGNDFAMDDIEIRLCVPAIKIDKLFDTACFNSSHTLKASYSDDGTFVYSGNKLVYRWQYSAVDDPKATWTTLEGDVENSKELNTSLTIDNVDISKQGYYRLVVANAATIDHPNCRAVSKSIYLSMKTFDLNNDTEIATFNQPRNINVLANDDLICCTDLSKLEVDTVAGSGPRHGTITINPDNSLTYTPYGNVSGIDSLDYSVKYLSFVKQARIYIIIPKPLSSHNFACPTSEITIGMHSVPEVNYRWYDANDKLLSTANEITVKKDNSTEQFWYVEALYKNKTSSRYQISVLKSDNCGATDPQGCVVEGQLLFREDFKGNDVFDPRVSSNDTLLPAGATEYTFHKSNDEINHNEYALVKYINNGYAWQQKFSDHTHPDDTTRGYMFLVDASNKSGKFYETRITGLCDIDKLYFSAWVANVIPKGSNAKHDPVLKFELLDESQNIIGRYVTSTVPRDEKNKTKWKNYGFAFDPEGYSSLILRIYNNTDGSDGNDFALDDIEIRLCVPPVTIKTQLFDTVCVGNPVTVNASYTDKDGAFTSVDGKLAFRWEYSADGNNWSVIGNDTTIIATEVQSTYTIDNVTEVNTGYYRFIVGNPVTINNTDCRVESATTFIDVIRKTAAPDLRIMITPSNSSHKVYLTSFLDTVNFTSIKWESNGIIPNFTDEATGELDAKNFMPRRVYTYKYTASMKCGSSSAKAYIFTSIDKLNLKNKKEIFVCKDLKHSEHVQLDQILGMEDNGTWHYPNDADNAIANNVKVSSPKYANARIFNAHKAYAEAGTSYDIANRPETKAFKFKYTAISGDVFEFTIVVGI